jgi:hypothetical protein
MCLARILLQDLALKCMSPRRRLKDTDGWNNMADNIYNRHWTISKVPRVEVNNACLWPCMYESTPGAFTDVVNLQIFVMER